MPDEVFERVITLNGSSQSAQAATCEQYIRQTWPFTAERIIGLINEVLRDQQGHPHQGTSKASESRTLVTF